MSEGRRRLKRRLKAVASIALALAAGTFLACQKRDALSPPGRPRPAPNPTTPEDPDPIRASTGPDASVPGITADAGRDARGGATVDREEHRRGMPVPDNLLE